jgi:hypothetical protein
VRAQVLPLLPAREDPEQQYAGVPEPVMHAPLLPALPLDAPGRRRRDGTTLARHLNATIIVF